MTLFEKFKKTGINNTIAIRPKGLDFFVNADDVKPSEYILNGVDIFFKGVMVATVGPWAELQYRDTVYMSHELLSEVKD